VPYNKPMLNQQTADTLAARALPKRTRDVARECGRAHTGSRGDTTNASVPPNQSMTALVPIMGVVLVAFLVIGLALPVLPLHVHQGLGLSTFVVGLVTGSQFAASLISRLWSGHYADRRGAKPAVIVGLLAAVAGGLLYLLSLGFVGTSWLSATILLCGRALLGGAESFVITGAVIWGLALAGHTTLYAMGGFAAVAIATILLPLSSILFVAPLTPVVVQRGAQTGLMKVLGTVWLPGFGSALSTIGFGAMVAFSSLLSTERNWSPLWLIFSTFSIALVAARLFLGHTPDKLGGARVALACVFVEATGLALIWFASNSVLAAVGAALTGFGYSLVYPGLGVEAVKRAPPQSRGLAMGAYTVFLDVALGFGSPALGLLAGWTGLGSVFLASAILVLGTAAVAGCLLHMSSRTPPKPQTR
jgi:MFS family permease